jgi:thiamine biosynthesis lipoprotein
MQSILTDFKLSSSIWWIILLILSCKETSSTEKKLKGFALGTTYSIQFTSEIPERQVQKGIDSLLYLLNKSLSTYLPNSDISKINRGDTLLIVDNHFRKVFKKATALWKATSGYFDPTVGALVNAYGFGPGQPLNIVNQYQLDSLLLLTGWEKIRLLPNGTIEKKHPDIYIDFNALAKGYVVDIVGHYLLGLGHLNYMVEIGGEIVAYGNSPKTNQPWKIGIDDPSQGSQRKFIQTLYLKNQALASSGNYRKFRIDPHTSERYVHSINPITGLCNTSKILSTSVKAPDCMTADAWATALMVMPFEMGKQLIENDPELEALWIVNENKKNKIISSDGF